MDLVRRKLLTGMLALPLLGWSSAYSASGLPQMVVYRDPNCGCCGGWIEHMRKAGFPVKEHRSPDASLIKERLGVPPELVSCHTAQIGGYVVEGHVPAAAIRRLIEKKPQATGLAVPGMPVGSPGMEVAGRSPETYDVVLFGPRIRDTFARFRGDAEIKI